VVDAGAGAFHIRGWCPGHADDDAAAVAARALAAAAAAAERSLRVEGQWGTKIDAVVRRLLFLASHDPGAKTLVFSEWVDVLLVLESALAANGIRFLRAGAAARSAAAGSSGGAAATPALQLPRGRGGAAASAAAAIAAFQATPSISVLLLPVSRGANGLNLVEARHVIMMEPLLDPGAEAQAIKRVDRIGQAAPTCVHRFVVAASIEENIAALFGPRVAAAAAGDAAADAAAAAAAAAAVPAVVGVGAGGAPRLRASEVVSLLRQ
jgi:E3 ubiquitin-protein ligase SHPRH